MKKGQCRMFSNPYVLEEMISMRSQGYSYPKIAQHFGVDHTSIMYQCKKNKIVKGRKHKEPKRHYPQAGGHKICHNCGLLMTSEYRKEFPCEMCKDL